MINNAVEYIVCEAISNLVELQQNVTDALADGWKIIPEGFSVTYTGDAFYFHQTMYRTAVSVK